MIPRLFNLETIRKPSIIFLMDNSSSKHHYIPIFYTKRWAGDNGNLCVFSKPNGKVKSKWQNPTSTGWARDLYALRTFPAELRQQIEENFFKPLDSHASAALRKMELYGKDIRWTDKLSTGWTVFILSLLMRCPEDIEKFRDYWFDDFRRSNDELEAIYAEIRDADLPATATEFLATIPDDEVEREFAELLISMINNQAVGEKILKMDWQVIDTSDERLELLTSDRPVIRHGGFDTPPGTIFMPIGPHRIFVAANSPGIMERIRKLSSRDLVRRSNVDVVHSAAKYVYARDDSQRRFIENRFGADRQPTIIEMSFAAGRERREAMFISRSEADN